MYRNLHKNIMTDISSGYTLLEVMTVLAIMAILAMMTFPSFLSPIIQKRLNSSVHEMVSIFQMARLRAIKENSNIVVSFDPENDGFLDGNYMVFVDNGAGENMGNHQREADEPIIKIGSVLPSVDLYEAAFGNKQATRFNGMGLGLAGHVYFRNSRNQYMGIKVSITGSARIIESQDKGETWN